MNQVFVLAIVIAGLIGVGVVLATSESAAEPILGEESLSLPPPTKQKQDANDGLSLFRARDFEAAAMRRRQDTPWRFCAATSPRS